MSIGRVYIYKNGAEQPDHFAHGKPFSATWCMARDANGQYIRGTHTGIEIGSRPGPENRTPMTAADLGPDMRVKLWFGPKHPLNGFYEIRDDETAAA